MEKMKLNDEKVKGYEFHYKESINKRGKQLGGKGDEFNTYALDLLTASTNSREL